MTEITADETGPGRPAPLKTSERAWQILQSPAVKLLLIGFLLLLMFIPTEMVDGVISERESRQSEVENQIASGWGPVQQLASPLLAVPWEAHPADGLRHYGTLFLAPTELTVTGQLAPDTRALGFFRAVVYGADVHLSGNFDLSGAAVPNEEDAVLNWQAATLVLGASDLRAVGQQARLEWNGGKEPAVQIPYMHHDRDDLALTNLTYLEAKLPPIDPGQTGISFQTDITLRGVHSFNVIPLGPRTLISLSAPWQTPSFLGASLPTHREITKAGFRADWDIANVASVMKSEAEIATKDGSRCCGHRALERTPDGSGVALLEALPTYHMVERAAKYAMLFITLCFLTYFVFEILAGIAINILSYALLGASVAGFALLLVAIGEPLGFTAAYAISALLVAGQGIAYTNAVTGRRGLTLIFALVQVALFGFLYVVLSLETYSLLAGAVALFVVLSILMAVTSSRRVVAA